MDRIVLLRRALGATLAMLLLPTAASAAVRYSSPTATATATRAASQGSISGTCSSAALPCRIDHAVNAASDGREGAVAVKDRRTGRTVLVRAGDAYLARR